jgi:predicted O-methyltransferase YrrM
MLKVASFDIAANFESICEDTEYRQVLAKVANWPTRSLISASARAHLWFLIRTLGFRDVLEIGTYLGGTTELLADAVSATGGSVLTLDPATAANEVVAAISGWPAAAREATTFKQISSGDYFYLGSLDNRREFDLIFVDGNHVHDYVLFDLTLSAQRIRPGGILAVDNAEITGVFHALRSFLAMNRSWRLLGASQPGFTLDDPDRVLTNGPDSPVHTVFLLAPQGVDIGDRLSEFWYEDIRGNRLDAVRLVFDEAGYAGDLRVHVKFTNSFGRSDTPPGWSMANRIIRIGPGDVGATLSLGMAAPSDPPVVYQHADVGLLWTGTPAPLRLSKRPELVMLSHST